MPQIKNAVSEEVRVPAVGESISEVILGQWYKQEGEAVSRDEDIVELESEKATFEAPAPISGVLERIVKQSGETAQVGEVIAYIAAEGSRTAPLSHTPQPSKPQPAPAPVSEKSDGSLAPETTDAAPRVMPAAARLLAEHGLRAEEVKATGPGGRVLKEDVARAVTSPADTASPVEPVSAPAAPAPRPAAVAPSAPSPRPAATGERLEERKPMSPLRRRIAARLTQAQQQAALLTTFNEADLSEVKKLRKEHGQAFEKRHGVKLGFMGFFVKAVVEALKGCPELNASIDEQDMVYHRYFDIGIAIGTERGLVVPILRNADKLGFADIELAINDFALRARNNQLKVDEMMGGTFTISNGGVYGSLLSTPIVNPPQSGVLGMHSIQDRPVAVDGQVVIRPMMYLALTYDHRIVDGREAVTFLRDIKQSIEDPARILIEI